ncbi:DUF3990 domain-containing protein [Motiliproteus coralliicola]|uniref:DUF3990 domain-containing protein n=1 Tax=Motiliproteus coralliicola TaxID=2283196 RepID=A0A369WFH0_9GAMM|nr:DUF3990 domain-containing protein [Motiliproteus coralliicola]RDE19404.1 DUF3990 domain-containing protein [Motiliproteus coralliicola]
MPWNNQNLVIYHGCDDQSAADILNNGVDLNRCQSLTDFGQGFYLTTNLDQASYWANIRCRPMIKGGNPVLATVIQFELMRDDAASRDILFFTNELPNTQYWDFAMHCRSTSPPVGAAQHKRHSKNPYDIVTGPVSLLPGQPQVIKDYDQISLHTSNAVNLLTTGKIVKQGDRQNPLL